MFCVYLTIYSGDKLPPYYIGSSSIKKVESGYFGSVASKNYKSIWHDELKNNPHLFDIVILDEVNTRKDAIALELIYQKRHNVVKNKLFVNMAYAAPDGSHGRDVSGPNHPLYGSNNCKGYKHFHHPDTKETKFCLDCPTGFIEGRYNPKADVNSGRKLYYDPITLEKKMLYACPNGWLKGHPNISHVAGRKWYYDPVTLKSKMLSECPSGWLEGRPKFNKSSTLRGKSK